MINRQCRGTTIAEMPLALWLILVCIAFPMIILVTVSIKFGFFWNAAREAAQNAARCETFLSNPDATVGGLSSVNTANQFAALASSSFSGIKLNKTNVYIVVTQLATQTVSVQQPNQALQSAADPDNNMYQVKVQLDGQVDPLLRGPFVFGSIPGLTAAFPVTVASQANVEHTEGLNN